MITIKVPSKIQIGGHTYAVLLDKGLITDGTYYSIDHMRQHIKISPLIAETIKTASLIRALLCAVNNVYNAGDVEDKHLDGLGEGLNQIFQQWGIELDWSEIEVKN